MDDAEAQVGFEGVEVAVVMEEGVVFCDAECSDETIDRFTDGDATTTEILVVVGRG